MAKVNYKVRLQKLLDNELSSSSSNDKKQVVSAYKSLMDILNVPQLSNHLHGYHEVLFECISQIILTPSNQFFDDNELRLLLDLASNARVLSMSQNQIIDGWLQNIEERIFEKPDAYEDEDDDDDDLYEDATESEEEEEEEEIIPKRNNNRRSDRGGGHQREQKEPSHHDLKSASLKEKSLPSPQIVTNQRNTQAANSRDHRGGRQHTERNDVVEISTRGNHDHQGARGSENVRGKGRQAPPFDNKYGVDLQLYDCYICGEYGHVQYDCPKKPGNPQVSSRSGLKTKKPQHRLKSSSSNASNESTPNGTIQEIYNLSSKLLNSSQKADERNETLNLFLSHLKDLRRQHGENLSKFFLEKETFFYSLFCHIAQNNFLFSNEQYSKLYHLKNILLPQQHRLLNEDRAIFSRQRILIPLNIISTHINTTKQIQQTIFNDFQEYIIRSTSPISLVLYDLIQFLLKSNIHIDTHCLDNFTTKILFDMKKSLFSNEQITELQSYLSIRTKRFERNNAKQIWKDRLNLFKTDRLTVDLNQWMREFEQILKSNDDEQEELSTNVIHHAMWYFAILLMASSGHLNREQYEYLFNRAIQSRLFNSKQIFYFQFYLKQGQAPIMIKELNQIQIQLETDNIQEKQFAYEQIRTILHRTKPGLDNEELTDSTDILPIIDNHVLSRLISLVETICSDSEIFSSEQCRELLDQFLHHSSIVRPLSLADQNRLLTFYSRPMSLNELKTYCLSIPSDLNEFFLLLKNRIMINQDAIYDYLTEIILKIFQNQRKYSNEKCQELKFLVEKKIFGKKRTRLINETYQKFRLNQKDPLPINPTILNQLLTRILSHDDQAHLEFFILLEEISYSIDLNEITIEFEINRCLLSTIILVITNSDSPNTTKNDEFRQRLQTIIEKENEFFSSLLTEQQYRLINSLTSTIDGLIDSIKKDSNDKTWMNLIDFIQKDRNDQTDFDKIIQFILHTFDDQLISTQQTLQISNLIFDHPKFSNITSKNRLQFILELLQHDIHSSPKLLLDLISKNEDNHQITNQIKIILQAKHGKYATEDWKQTMMQLVTTLSDRQDDQEELINIARQSSMAIFKQQVESKPKKTSRKQSEDNREPSAIPKTTDHSTAHREMFRYLESNDPSMNAVVVQQLRTYLLDEQLPSEILLPKFLQALQTIIRDSQKFSEVSLDEWSALVTKNRGKIFSNDSPCDELLLNILFARLQMPNDTFKSIQYLIQSRKGSERNQGLEKLLLLLNNTQMTNEKNPANHLSTVSNSLYHLITEVVFDQKFNDIQVRKCLKIARNSWLLNNDHRQKLNL